MKRYFLLAVSLVLVFAGVGFSATYYVDNRVGWGDDINNNGLSTSAPFATIQHAVDQTGSGSQSDTIKVRNGGVYHAEVLIENKNNVTLTTYGSASDPDPVIDGDDVRPTTTESGTGLRLGLVEIRDSKNITTRNFKVIESEHSGIVVREEGDQLATDNVTVEFCEVNDIDGWGILCIGDNWNNVATAGPATNITIANCKVSETNTNQSTGEALTFAHVHDFWCYENDVWDNYKEGIDVVNGCDHGFVYRNEVRNIHPSSTYFVNGRGAGIYIDGNAKGNTDIEIYDNIVYDQGNGIQVGSEDVGDVDDVKIYNNIVYNVKWHNFKLSHGGNECTSNCGDRTKVKVHNNTFVGDVANEIIAVIEPEDENKIAGFEVKNNILYRASDQTKDMITQPGTFATSYYSYNLFYDGGGTITGALGSNRVLDDPDFESETWSGWPFSSDYYLATSSPAREAGATPIVEVSDDIAGNSRPDDDDYDIGAFEGEH